MSGTGTVGGRSPRCLFWVYLRETFQSQTSKKNHTTRVIRHRYVIGTDKQQTKLNEKLRLLLDCYTQSNLRPIALSLSV